MSSRFQSHEAARDFGASMAGVNPQDTEFVEDNSLHVLSAAGFLSDPKTPEGKKMIDEDLGGQTGYRFKNRDGVEVGIVVAPFRDGFCAWGINLSTKTAVRF